MNTVETLLTTTEAADYLRIHRATLYTLTRSGQLPYYKIGHALRFSREQLSRYLEHAERVPSLGETSCTTDSMKGQTARTGGPAGSKAAKRLGNRLGLK